jgi:hypothetical protein
MAPLAPPCGLLKVGVTWRDRLVSRCQAFGEKETFSFRLW